jgi:hypothetical protein
MSVVYPYGSSGNVTVAATHSIAVQTLGKASVYRVVGYPNYPTTKQLLGTVENSQEIFGSYSSGATIVVDAGASEVYYATGAQPSISDTPSEIDVLGGDSGRVVYYDVEALAGNGVRQGVIAISLNRASGEDFTWDGNPDCGIKVQVTNRAENDTNEGACRGLDVNARNRGDDASWCNGASLNVRNDSGSTVAQLWGIQTRIEDYGVISDKAIGLDVELSIEDDTGSPTRYGIQVRNTDQSSQSACDAVFAISNTSTNGFTNLFDLSGLTAANGTITSTSGTAATSFAGRLRILDASGTAAYINLYSTSNEA